MSRPQIIPSGPGQLRREFFQRHLPVLVFIGTAGAVALLWSGRFSGTQFTGEAESVTADVTTVQAGTLATLSVERFQAVRAGDVISTLDLMETEVVRAAVGVMAADLAVLRSRMGLDERRNETDYESLQVRWLEARVSLAVAKVELENARREAQRAARLFAEKIISESEHDLAQAIAASLQTSVAERTMLVERLGASLKQLERNGPGDQPSLLNVLSQSLAAQELRLERTRTNVLLAPISGIVKIVNHRAGERVPAGTVIATIAAPTSDRIIGYVRQPLNIMPKPGMTVEIRTRRPRREVVRSTVLGVGPGLEPVVSPMRLRGFDNATERGLPFLVAVPPGLKVQPGELVDLIVHPGVPSRH